MKSMISKTSTNMFVSDTVAALALYERIFSAVRIDVYEDELNNGKKGARFSIGESLFVLADESPENGAKSPLTLGGTPVCFQLMVDNVEELVEGAISAGCTLQMPVTVVPGRFKVANVTDPFGFIWSISEVYN